MRGLACDADVPLPLDGLVSLFLLEGHTYVPGPMDDLISVTCHLMQNFVSQGWVTKEGVSKSQILLQDVLGAMYGSVDMFSRCTVAWEPVSTEEGDLDHPSGTSRPDAHASATKGVVKLDRATANRAPGAPGKDEALWELVYFFDNMDNPAGTPRKETGDPQFTRQHLVVTFMDLILFARRMAAPQARLPSRGYEVLALSLTVPHPTQFFQGIAEQGYMWQNVPYGITRDIGVYGRSGTFWSWGKAQRGAWFAALCHDDPDQRLGLVCVRVGHLAPMQEFLVFSQFVCVIPVKECLCLHHLGRADNHFRSKMIDPTLFQLFRAAGFPTCASLAADPGIRAYVADPQPPSPACTAAGVAHASPRSAVGLPVDVRIPDVPDLPCTNPQAPPHMGADMCGRAATTKAHLKPTPSVLPEQMGTLSLPRSPANRALKPTPPFDTLNLALLHVVQRAARSGGLSLGENQRSLAPWDFDPQGDGVLPWLLPWVRVLI
ncbi:hypothetical protein K439DRAFT_1624254 [Ramaria rubella]|nr:hypothetical protein K439DRAFT_1624254 [Ramaria rubella]